VIPRAVSDDGALIYTDDKGELRSLQSGEISIRL
jgi:biotin-(acetyl-CoA carboxylase) ligase